MDGNVTDLYIYFHRPHNNEMNKLKYTEFYKEYCWSRTLRKKVSKVPEKGEVFGGWLYYRMKQRSTLPKDCNHKNVLYACKCCFQAQEKYTI